MKRRAFIGGGMAAILASRRAPAFCLAMRNSMMRPSAPPTPPLPYDYAVEYIETDGVASYIDTGVKSSSTFRVALDFALASLPVSTSDPSAIICGARSSSNLSIGRRFAICLNGTHALYFRNPTSDTNQSAPADFVRHTAEFEIGSLKFDGTVLTQIGAPTSGFEHDFCIGKDGEISPGSGAERTYANVRIFSCILSDNGVVVFDGIPVVANGVAGLYDSISGTVKTNAAATGTITAGPRRAQ